MRSPPPRPRRPRRSNGGGTNPECHSSEEGATATAASPAAAAKSRAQRKKKEGGANPESHSTGGRGGARGRKRRAVQNHNPIAVRMELILLKCSGMVNFHNYFHDVLTVYACLTILGYVIMLLSHLSPCDYGFGTPLGPPWVPSGLDLSVYGPLAPKEALGASQIHNPSG